MGAFPQLVKFQLAATRRRLASLLKNLKCLALVSTRSHAKAAGDAALWVGRKCNVSTRSHAKAAGWGLPPNVMQTGRFNSQPREGGWKIRKPRPIKPMRFNSQPREGGWTGAREMSKML